MNTRTFIKSILLASLAPAAFIPKQSDRFKWKKSESGMWVTNPEWENAPYEFGYWFHSVFAHRFNTIEDAKVNQNFIPPMLFKRA